MNNYTTPYNVASGEIIETADTSYEAAVNNYNKALRILNDTKEKVKKGVIDTYDSLRSAETRIKEAEIELKKLHSQLAIAEKQLELGQTTQLSVDELKHVIREAENSVLSAKNSYAISVIAFSNPNILFSASAGN